MIYDNKYSRCYFRLMDRARDRERGPGTERHHILPKALGGSNAAGNLVYLTYREHFLAHWLLTKCTEGEAKRLMHGALACMNCSRTGRALASWQFAIARAARREASRGQKFALGAVRSAETRSKMSRAARNRSPETREKLGVASRNRSPETRAKLRAAATNLSPETRRKRSEAASQRKHSGATKAKLSQLLIGQKRCQGRKLSEETRRKIGEASRATQARLREERAAAK